MKKIILITLFTYFISCSPEEQEKIDALGINTPAWIQGTWIVKDDDANIVGLKFASNSFIKIEEDGTESNVMLSYVLLQGLGTDVTVDEFTSTNNYAIKISTGYSDDWYRFTKISSEEISWDNAPPFNEAEIYVKRN
ncbi:hypothetical protein [Seonamhaeicola maritimus]|uniref:hypothetical protein n=1 Tax=Seonamhaeicola maritimus TaxID=2591822 RepID=UPI00249477E8|nr:hypothetical protein [Seonamhaeicola maritimus]